MKESSKGNLNFLIDLATITMVAEDKISTKMLGIILIWSHKKVVKGVSRHDQTTGMAEDI